MSPELVLAFDQKSRDSFLKSFEYFSDSQFVVKLGLRLLPLLKDEDFKFIKKSSKKIFIDVKLHDIPSQVHDAVLAWADKGADFLTIHMSGSESMLKEALKASNKSKLQLLAVTVLTSLSDVDLKKLGFSKTINETVIDWFHLGTQWGLSGFVMSPEELKNLNLNAATAKNLHFCTPGLQLNPGENQKDQSRSVLLDEAIKWGSTLPVMGRGIFEAQDPKKALSIALDILKYTKQGINI